MDSQEMRMTDGRIAQLAPALDERRYRSGRGGYDPEVAAQLARAKFAYRQRAVLALAIGAIATLVLAYVASSLLWWIHAVLDMALVGYLGYLRRQVRIEEEIRQRRAARLVGSRAAGSTAVGSRGRAPADDASHEATVDAAHERPEPVQEPSAWPAAAHCAPHPTAVALDLDDEDPIFDELKPAFQPPYRRAAGE
jgi:membrane protein implicated in regulation of membrane protease activity